MSVQGFQPRPAEVWHRSITTTHFIILRFLYNEEVCEVILTFAAIALVFILVVGDAEWTTWGQGACILIILSIHSDPLLIIRMKHRACLNLSKYLEFIRNFLHVSVLD